MDEIEARDNANLEMLSVWDKPVPETAEVVHWVRTTSSRVAWQLDHRGRATGNERQAARRDHAVAEGCDQVEGQVSRPACSHRRRAHGYRRRPRQGRRR